MFTPYVCVLHIFRSCIVRFNYFSFNIFSSFLARKQRDKRPLFFFSVFWYNKRQLLQKYFWRRKVFFFDFLMAWFGSIIFIAILPALILMILIFRQDKIEKEPAGLLLKIFLLGAVSTILAGWLERLALMVLDVFHPNRYSTVYAFIEYFCIVALVEEGCKYLVMKKTTWRHPAFNYRFDAVVYGVFSALGFAAAENILYVLNLGIGVAPIRAVTAVPLHCICGIFMGHYYGQQKACERWNMKGRQALYKVLALLVPILIHGFYDFAATSSSGLMHAAFIVFIIVLYIVAFFSVRRYSIEDTYI